MVKELPRVCSRHAQDIHVLEDKYRLVCEDVTVVGNVMCEPVNEEMRRRTTCQVCSGESTPASIIHARLHGQR